MSPDQMRISLIRMNGANYIEDASLLHALRDQLHWEMVSREEYYALGQVLPAGVKVLVDYAQLPVIASIDDALAAHEEQQVNKAAASLASVSVAAKPKMKKEKKGLTARQQRELDELRKALGKDNG